MLCPSKRLFVAAAILVFVAAAILVRSAVFIEGTNDSMEHTAAGGEMVPARESASLLPQLKRKQKNPQLRAAHTDEESAATRVFDTSPILARKRPLRFAVASVAIFDGGLSEDVKIALENHAACVNPTYLKNTASSWCLLCGNACKCCACVRSVCAGIASVMGTTVPFYSSHTVVSPSRRGAHCGTRICRGRKCYW